MNIDTNTTRKCFNNTYHFPLQGSKEEREAFISIQQRFTEQYEKVFPDKLAPRTILILPSLSLDQDILSKVKGAVHYEERMLCLLMLLRMPTTKIIYVTSVPVADSIVDYYLHLLPGITGHHARKRLTMLSCYDSSVKPLTEKILARPRLKVLERPRLMERIRELIPDTNSAHLTCYNITSLEKTLAVQLGIPLFGTDPDKFYEGSKSGSRKNFRDSGVNFPDGFEDLTTIKDIVKALADLKRRNPLLRKAVIKMNDGFSGDGNAIYTYPTLELDSSLEKNIENSLSHQLKMVAKEVSEKLFFEKFQSMGGIVEVFIDGDVKMSPSVQCVISPSHQIEIVSTHDQLLGGEDGQVFLGAVFPADEAYSISLAKDGKKIAQTLAGRGALGRFAIDFISVKQLDDSWKHYAIEINLRKGGTTHPFLMLQFLTNGIYDETTGIFKTPNGQELYYFASDNVQNDAYKGLTPHDLINIAMFHGLHFDGASQKGVVFHMIGALSQYGKMGMVCIGSSPQEAYSFYIKTIEVLNAETGV